MRLLYCVRPERVRRSRRHRLRRYSFARQIWDAVSGASVTINPATLTNPTFWDVRGDLWHNWLVEDVPSALMDFAVFTLDHAAKSVVSSGGPLTPFSMVEGPHEENRQMTRFVTETLEEGLEQARRKVRTSSGIHRAAVAWDGYLTMEGQRTDAVFVEASEAGHSESIILGQRYVPYGEGAHRLGDITLAGRGEPLF